jgi:hypothetical protein
VSSSVAVLARAVASETSRERELERRVAVLEVQVAALLARKPPPLADRADRL